jgi:two-component system response regulator FixJ
MSAETRIYVIDDDEAVRDSLTLHLEAAGFEVKAFASAIEFLKEATTLPAGCVISDVRMPEIDGLELQNRLAEMQLNFPVIIVTGHGDVDFIEKPFAGDAILGSIRLAQSRFAVQQASTAASEAALARVALLTPRERDVFEELVHGKQNKVIAFDLNISPRTVEVHRARVLDKMQAHSLSELVRFALAAGIQIKS